MIRLSLHGTPSSHLEHDPRVHLGLEVRILETELEFTIVSFRQVLED